MIELCLAAGKKKQRCAYLNMAKIESRIVSYSYSQERLILTLFYHYTFSEGVSNQ
jgi:hypothetical protein